MDPDESAASAMYLILRSGLRADMPWEDVPPHDKDRLVEAWHAGQDAYTAAMEGR